MHSRLIHDELKTTRTHSQHTHTNTHMHTRPHNKQTNKQTNIQSINRSIDQSINQSPTVACTQTHRHTQTIPLCHCNRAALAILPS